MVERHWPTGEIAPVTVLAVADHPQSAEDAGWTPPTQMLADIRTIANVDNVRGLAMPLGRARRAAENAAVNLLAHDKVTAEFVSSGQSGHASFGGVERAAAEPCRIG